QRHPDGYPVSTPPPAYFPPGVFGVGARQTQRFLVVFCSMGWLHSLFSPLRRMWVRAHSERRNRRGMHLLYKDVQSCQDEDVQVLWSILIDSHRHPALLKLKL
uniref:Uncharacterized protein n=1 Tax=Setaria italica TaxID=4555 RepID=K4A3A0_SETIT